MQWEYRTYSLRTGGFLGGKVNQEDLDQALNEAGREGWELVSVFDTTQGSGQTRDVIAVFKRSR
jgi:hypothetical protein